jgi:predicted O-methyltransferase YrrM
VSSSDSMSTTTISLTQPAQLEMHSRRSLLAFRVPIHSVTGRRSLTAGLRQGARYAEIVSIPSFRKAARRYREDYALHRSDPRFGQALDLALDVDGFTDPIELSLLYHLTLAAETGAVVEIGSYLGRSTIVLASAARDTGRHSVAAVDPHMGELGIQGEDLRDTRGEFLRNIERAGVARNVRLLHTTSVEAARHWDGGSVSLLFVDGLHTREAVLDDVGSWAEFLAPTATVVFDDFLPFAGVRSAVRELRSDGIVRGMGLIVGKMAAFGPANVMRAVPAPPGARILSRLGDRTLNLAIKALATRPAGS